MCAETSCPPPDLAETWRFLSLLDPSPDARFGFATAADRGHDPRLATRCYGTPTSGKRLSGPKRGQPCSPARLLGFMQTLGAGCFVTVQAIDGEGATTPHVTRIRAVIADADTPEQLANLHAFIERSGLVPSITVASGGRTSDGADKLQCYWLMADCHVSTFAALQALLLSRVGTDPAVRDAARLLRLPGFYHIKREPRMTQIIAASGVVYDCRNLSACIEAQPLVQAAAPLRGVRTRSAGATTSIARMACPAMVRLHELFEKYDCRIKPAVRELIEEIGNQRRGRHDSVVSLVGYLVRKDWTEPDVLAFLVPLVNEHFGDGDWSKEILDAFRHAHGREQGRTDALRAALGPKPRLSREARS